VASFTADGVFSNARGRYEGARELAAYVAGWIGDGGVRYWVNNLLVHAGESNESATGVCYLAIIATGGAGRTLRIELTGRYTDTLRLEGGEWKFLSRHIARD
jgi:hypothetical protein